MQNLIIRAAPIIFVVLWSTGFIGAKYGLPYAEAFTFLAIRFAITFSILISIVFLFTKTTFTRSIVLHSMVVGCLVHGLYLGGVFFAIDRGMSAGVSSLVVAIQPLLTVFIASFLLDERASNKQMLSLLAALFGVVLVLAPTLFGGEPIEGLSSVNLVAVGLAVMGISIGTVYQKRFVPKADLLAATTSQYLGALIVLSIASFGFETQKVEWTQDFIFALFWLVFILSIGAVGLLMYLIEKSSALSVASLFYLVPISTAVIAYFVFGEKLQIIQIVGAVIVVVAIAWGSKRKRRL